jgi:two-component system chemotaxis response regulator CheB
MTYRVVVIGASYGGFDALKVVLGALPATFPLPVMVVQHQGAGSTELAALLQRYTPLPVVEANDKDEPRAGWIHLAPPGYHLLLDAEGLALSVDAPVVYARPSIDVLFESAADVYGAATIGVILTGTGRDGAAGLARIKERGGVTIVQDPETALRRMMPDAALAGSSVDWMLALGEIGGRLVALCASATPESSPTSMDEARRALPSPSHPDGDVDGSRGESTARRARPGGGGGSPGTREARHPPMRI